MQKAWSRAASPAGRSAVVLVAVLMAAAGVVWRAPGGGVGLDVLGLAYADIPPPPADRQERPLRLPPVAPPGGGHYRFLQTQENSTVPVAYDPCRPVHYVVRPAGEPPGAGELLHEAIERVSAATGLVFVDDGTTTEGPSEHRDAYQPARYGKRWAPVLIVFSSPAETPVLSGRVAGQAGSVPFDSGRPGSRRYVTGSVALDGPQLAERLATPGGADVVRGIIEHELGHLVGLGHVADTTQLMHESTTRGVVDFGLGDLEGLAKLWTGRCFGDA